ncbi:hypothetical protein AAFF_G00214460 [Aldrovandia affinis]|uniref:Uncharacterized protein n=1 Tax=Aldrovandia affinis TaxID=143900 RepID=A0AAD7W4F8_9TELE|nr:hypothetical protein AAFF_G00214460 [Aldrovandia affinis]
MWSSLDKEKMSISLLRSEKYLRHTVTAVKSFLTAGTSFTRGLDSSVKIDCLKRELQENTACASEKDRKTHHKQQELNIRLSRQPSGSNSRESLTLQRKPLLPPAPKTRQVSGRWNL